MKEIRKNIKEHSFRTVYLLFGEEAYRVAQAKLMLEHAIVHEGDEMNFTEFSTSKVDLTTLSEILNTLPFFAEKRLVLLNKTQILTSGKEDLIKVMEEIPPTSVLIIVEQNVDKRLKAYKWIKKNGYAAEFTKKDMKEQDYTRFAGVILKKAGKKIKPEDAILLVRRTGQDLFTLKNETDKLIAYAGEEEIITRQMIDAMVSTEVEDKVFELIDSVAAGDRKRVLRLYQDLILLKEAPLKILSLLVRQYRILIRLYDMSRQHIPEADMAERAHIPRFALRNSLRQLSGYDEEKLMYCLSSCLAVDADIKSGKIGDRIGLEMMLIGLS